MTANQRRRRHRSSAEDAAHPNASPSHFDGGEANGGRKRAVLNGPVSVLARRESLESGSECGSTDGAGNKRLAVKLERLKVTNGREEKKQPKRKPEVTNENGLSSISSRD